MTFRTRTTCRLGRCGGAGRGTACRPRVRRRHEQEGRHQGSRRRHRVPARFPLTLPWPPSMSSVASRRRPRAPAVQGGFDATCGLFYAGVWASNLDWGNDNAGNVAANIEMDWYAGIKPKTGPITWDLGVIYYTYPNGNQPAAAGAGFNEPNYFEFKVGWQRRDLEGRHAWRDGLLLARLPARNRPRVDRRDRVFRRLCRRSACSRQRSAHCLATRPATMPPMLR